MHFFENIPVFYTAVAMVDAVYVSFLLVLIFGLLVSVARVRVLKAKQTTLTPF